jgi:hypothetical protein
MRRKRWVMQLWPGLPQLWLHGSWWGLAAAMVTAAVLNLALLGSFGWSELIAPRGLRVLWLTLGVVWVASAAIAWVGSRRQGSRVQAGSPPDAFEPALDHYLRGDWFQAERLLVDLLRSSPRDLDARLMLASLWRHTGRLDEAAAQLDLLTRLEGAEKWEWEVRGERELLRQARERADGPDAAEACRNSTDPPAEMTDAA